MCRSISWRIGRGIRGAQGVHNVCTSGALIVPGDVGVPVGDNGGILLYSLIWVMIGFVLF